MHLASLTCVEVLSEGEAAFQQSLQVLSDVHHRRGLQQQRQPQQEQQPPSDGNSDAAVNSATQVHNKDIKVEYRVCSAGSLPIEELAKHDVIVLDPPRKGLEPELLAKLTSPELSAARSVQNRLRDRGSHSTGGDNGDKGSHTGAAALACVRRPEEPAPRWAEQWQDAVACQTSSVLDHGNMHEPVRAPNCTADAAGRPSNQAGAECAPDRLVYLSCGLPAMLRDLRPLLGSGVWRLALADAFIFFPGTDSIETLVVLERVASN